MKFIPVHGTKVLFSIWETRVKDFQAFLKETRHKPNQNPRFQQTSDDPVVMVSWDDAKAFCEWLSAKEGRRYRLPTQQDREAAVGRDKYPWGENWPPPSGTENVAGEESQIGQPNDPKEPLKGYQDKHPRTSPVGSYKPTRSGLYDVGGNVREWLESQPKDIPNAEHYRIASGGGWARGTPSFLTSSTALLLPTDLTGDYLGFRCVLDPLPPASSQKNDSRKESLSKSTPTNQETPPVASPVDLTNFREAFLQKAASIPYTPPVGTRVERITCLQMEIRFYSVSRKMIPRPQISQRTCSQLISEGIGSSRGFFSA